MANLDNYNTNRLLDRQETGRLGMTRLSGTMGIYASLPSFIGVRNKGSVLGYE